ncbi:putative MYST-like histone acetyltransferase 1 [Cyclospora cayetanensis]|uniref:Histone acetyltransferase n=1 Tax=Cyclospora cayetanensis TaxID=88456 RepID=A0A6P6RWE5_9EIME|nr:putative MYST-like histone acetyltransferase 1 [Cyclospora cayetanensis]
MKRTAASSSSSSLASCSDSQAPPQKVQCLDSSKNISGNDSLSSGDNISNNDNNSVISSSNISNSGNVGRQASAVDASCPGSFAAASAAPTAAARGTNSSSKGKGVAPKGGKQLNPARFTDSYALQFPNALSAKAIVWARDPVSLHWRPCKIIHARPNAERRAAAAAAGIPSSFGAAARKRGPFGLRGAAAAAAAAAAVHTSEQQQQQQQLLIDGNVTGEPTATNSNSSNGSSWLEGSGFFEAATTLGPSDYDYYVHFLGLDRRLDCWRSWSELRETREELPSDEPMTEEEEPDEDDEHAGLDEEYLREHEEATKLKTVERISIGSHLVDCWYFSPYPAEVQDVPVLFICEFCLSFFVHESELQRHALLCECKHPPGNEIYRDDRVSMFEVDGTHCRVYCENLCFLSKLFLDHKTLRSAAAPLRLSCAAGIAARAAIRALVLLPADRGFLTSYFFPAAASMLLMQHQRKGYGKFLISFSYSLSKRERRAGGPERPLSDLGRATYFAYWTEQLLALLQPPRNRVSLQELSEATSIEFQDVVACLEKQGVLQIKGDCCFLLLPPAKTKALREAIGRPSREVVQDALHWVPYDYYLAPLEVAPQQ